MLGKYIKIRGRAMFTILLVLSLTGCLGGGGGDSAAVVQPLTYVGNTAPADISLANAPTLLVNALFGGVLASDIPAGVSVSAGEVLADDAAIYDNLLSMFHYSMDDIIGTATNGYSFPLALDINETVYCDSGYYTMQGTLDDYTGTGTLAINYVNCVNEGVTYNGAGSMYVGHIDYYSFNATMDFVLLTMTSPNYRASMSGSFTIDDSIYGNQLTETITMNCVIKDDVSNKMYKFENYARTISITDIYLYDSSASISYSGTVYDSINGGITVNTILPLSFSSYTKTNPDNGGPLIFTGNSSSIRLTVESERHVLLELDLDGNVSYEVIRYVLWQEIDYYTNLDLTDSDGDGMHNSWETTYLLDPDKDDAGDDADVDGYTNLAEYQGGTDPQNPLSPPVAP
jgi:hypothetical protein